MNFVRSIVMLLICLVVFSCKPGLKGGKGSEPGSSRIPGSLPWSQRMAETVMKDYPELWKIEQTNKPRWSYTEGLVALAFLELWENTGNDRYFQYAKGYADTMIESNGKIDDYNKDDYNLDNLNPGKILFNLYDTTHENKYRIALDTLYDQLKGQPRTSQGGFWHKKMYPYQMWLDGLYMGGPFYAQYAKEFNKPKDFDDIARWIILITEKNRDPETGLLYHGWDESRKQKWADPVTGLSKNFWGRGMGWYSMALVDILDFFPKDHPKSDSLIRIVQQTASAVVSVQDDSSGIWYQVLDKGDSAGNYLEGSVSCMFTYFLLKAAGKGYIDSTAYLPDARKAYRGILDNLVQVKDDGRIVISPVCAVAGLGGNPYRNGSFEYYIHEARRDNDPKAVGPFIMASLLYEKMTNKEK